MTSSAVAVSSVIKNYKYSQNAFLSKEVEISLTQEKGLNYKSLVKPGDKVKEGEIIAKATTENGNTTYIHASLPGTVLDIAPCYSSDGKQDFAIKIKFGGSLSYLGKLIKEEPVDSQSKDQIIEHLIDKGVVNTFITPKPENLGLQLKNNSDFKNLIVRLFDEDPYRVTDSLITKFYFDEILKGAKIAAKAIDAGGIVFVIDQKLENKEAIKSKDYGPNIRFVEMNIKRYPCGTQREITSAFKRSGMKKTCNFDITKKDLYIDASTAYEIYKAIGCSIPAISRMVHFSGDCLYSSCLLDVKTGTPLKDIVNQLGGFAKRPSLIIINGKVSGNAVQSVDVPISKYVKSVEFISSVRTTNTQVYSCINCGNCRFACPKKLSPDILYMNTVNFKFMPENFAASSIGCIECGLCNTVCPARLPLSQTISLLKDKYTKE